MATKQRANNEGSIRLRAVDEEELADAIVALVAAAWEQAEGTLDDHVVHGTQAEVRHDGTHASRKRPNPRAR
jgi:hypothetical protein